jgi:hypothetical protein
VLDVIPPLVFRAIQAHLRERTAHAELGWEAGSDEEDTLTGDLGGSLRTGWIDSSQNGDPWFWRITYKKFRSKGDGALETITGADGIFQVEVHQDKEKLIGIKGLIFQAKKYQGSSRSNLIGQVELMERIAPGGSAVFEFGPKGYRGASSREILDAREHAPTRIPHPTEKLGGYLADEFMPCASGLRGMYYDAIRRFLVVPRTEGISVLRTSLRHRIAVEVTRGRQR